MQTALVTGASRGIGRATALQLAREGWFVLVHYHVNAAKAEAVLAELQCAGGSGQVVQADLSDEHQIMALFAVIDALPLRLGAVVNNAGTLYQQTTVEHLTVERINQVFALNVTAPFVICREAVKRMAKKYGGEGGAIVNVSSAASRLGAPGEYVDYAASKGALDSLTIGLSKEVASQGIRVNAVRPGLIHTDIHARAANPIALLACSMRSRCSVAVNRKKWRPPSPGLSATTPPTAAAALSILPVGCNAAPGNNLLHRRRDSFGFSTRRQHHAFFNPARCASGHFSGAEQHALLPWVGA